jgi:hypothetical protein
MARAYKQGYAEWTKNEHDWISTNIPYHKVCNKTYVMTTYKQCNFKRVVAAVYANNENKACWLLTKLFYDNSKWMRPSAAEKRERMNKI